MMEFNVEKKENVIFAEFPPYYEMDDIIEMCEGLMRVNDKPVIAKVLGSIGNCHLFFNKEDISDEALMKALRNE
jgi:hypothetical protein